MANISSKIKALKKLVNEYYVMLHGELIENPTEFLRVIKVQDTPHKQEHPHIDLRVYISRRALKHIVEKRSFELRKTHTEEEILPKIHLLIEQTPYVILNFDDYTYQYQPGEENKSKKHFYTKHYSGKPSIRILCDQTDRGLEICSLHFAKPKKKKKE